MSQESCPQLKQELEDIKTLKQEFDLELEQAFASGNTKKAKALRKKLEAGLENIQEKLWPFEALEKKKIEKQYEEQREIMEKTGILEKLSNNEMGIKGIDNKEYTFPKLEDIIKKMQEKKEIMETKAEQGFQELLIVPFGMKLDDLIKKYKQVILKHHQEGELLATKEKPTDPDEPLELDENEPVWAWERYNNADVEEKFVYYPESFNAENHKGKTKKETLKEQNKKTPTTAGYEILFIEDLPNIPREGKGQIKGREGNKRKQLETGKTPNEYLEILKNDRQYENEILQITETQIAYALKYLEKHHQIIDDYSGKGSASFQLGAYSPASDIVPYAGWNRVSQQAYLGGYVPGGSFSRLGVRSGVRV